MRGAEALAEAAERTPETAVPELLELRGLVRFRDPGLQAFGMILAARFELLGGSKEGSRIAIATLQLPTGDPGLPATLLDWRPPESLRDRLRLELVRLHRYLDDEPTGLGATVRSVMKARAPAWLAEADTATTDGDRLASALALDHGGTPSPSLVRRTMTTGPREEKLVWTGEERCAAHRQYPPLGFALARLALVRGDLDTARVAIDRAAPAVDRAARVRDGALVSIDNRSRLDRIRGVGRRAHGLRGRECAGDRGGSPGERRARPRRELVLPGGEDAGGARRAPRPAPPVAR